MRRARATSRPGPLTRFRRAGGVTALLAALLMAGVAAQQHYRHRPADWADYHRRAALAVASLPMGVDGPSGFWVGREVPVTQPARDLLRPNAARQVRFTDFSPGAILGTDPGPRSASLLVVQCRRAADMVGHYPPECYPAHGSRVVAERRRVWNLPDPRASDGTGTMRVEGTEYALLDPDAAGHVPGRPARRAGGGDGEDGAARATRVVVNFLVVPGTPAEPGRIAPDLAEVERAAADYRQRRRGAAQVQVVFDVDPARPPGQGRDARDRATVDLLTPVVPALRVLLGLDAGGAAASESPMSPPKSPAPLPDAPTAGR